MLLFIKQRSYAWWPVELFYWDCWFGWPYYLFRVLSHWLIEIFLENKLFMSYFKEWMRFWGILHRANIEPFIPWSSVERHLSEIEVGSEKLIGGSLIVHLIAFYFWSIIILFIVLRELLGLVILIDRLGRLILILVRMFIRRILEVITRAGLPIWLILLISVDICFGFFVHWILDLFIIYFIWNSWREQIW